LNAASGDQRTLAMKYIKLLSGDPEILWTGKAAIYSGDST